MITRSRPELPLATARSKSGRGQGGLARWVGFILNAAMRTWMAYVTIQVLARPDDGRWADVGLGLRTTAIVAVASMIIPAWHLLKRKGLAYPIWMDNLYLSTFVLDMSGNYFDLYDTYELFHLIPHAINTGAYVVVIGWLFGVSMLSAFGLANTLHILWEVQEAYGDLLLGTQNVHGLFDSINDLLVGVIGAGVYALAYTWLVRRPGREPPRKSPESAETLQRRAAGGAQQRLE